MASAASPLRFLSPGQLILCVILFFMPWVEVQCVPSPAAMKKGDLKLTGKDGPIPLAGQTGLQVATGDVSLSSEMKRFAEMGGGGAKKGPDGAKKEDNTGAAVLLFVYPIALVAGIAVGFALRPGGTRRIALAGCCGAALALVLLQAAIGFPIERDVEKNQQPQMGGRDPEISTRVVWKLPLYATLGLLLGATGTAFLDGGTPKPARRREDDFDEAAGDEGDRADGDDPNAEERPKRRPRDDD